MSRRVRVTLALAVAVWCCGAAISTQAQTSAAVTLTLASQTSWTTHLDDPVLHATIVATNVGTTSFGDLAVVGALGPAFTSRLDYEESLVETPTTVVGFRAVPVDGSLDAGATRTFSIDLDMDTMPGVSQDDSGIYPLRLELRSGGGAIAGISTNAIHFAREPQSPLRFTWWFELDAPWAFDPSGVFVDPTLEAALAPRGSLSAPVDAIAALTATRSVPIDLAIEPSLLEQATLMAAGYRRPDGTTVAAGEGGAAAAQAFLDRLADVATSPGVRVLAEPLDGPSIPSLLRSGLEVDVNRQEARGVGVIRDVLHVSPITSVIRPPEGRLDEDTITHLADPDRPPGPVTTILADANAVDRPPREQSFAPLPTAEVVGSDGEPVQLVLPDPSTQALLERVDLLADPVRGAQAVLGELAVIWKEEPVPEPPDELGIAVAPPADLPPTIWRSLVPRLADAPFLSPQHPEELAAAVVPTGPRTTLVDPATESFSSSYAERILQLHHDVDAYSSMLVDHAEIPERLRRYLLLAEAPQYLGSGETAGAAWLDPVAVETQAAFTSTTPQVQQVFTFTGREGTIPLRMGDPGDVSLRVVVGVASSQFDFPNGDQQEVVLERPNQLVSFDVVARASGQNPIAVTVRTPDGRVISEQTIVVRTTAVSSIALLITGGAAVLLLFLYARRWRRRSR
jgi:hypothetical protein